VGSPAVAESGEAVAVADDDAGVGALVVAVFLGVLVVGVRVSADRQG